MSIVPRFPIFVPTKGRYENPHTIKAFEEIGVPYTAVVERQERDHYARVVRAGKLLVLPFQNKGLIATRNWIWMHARDQLRVKRFWTFDDNIRAFYRLHKNIKYRMKSPVFLRVMEDFAERYSNLVVAGMQYEMFVPRRRKCPPYILNTRVYSNMLIMTASNYFYKLFYNDDTDLCLRILKDGNCTLQFCCFLADKITTMITRGGNTDYYKRTNDRLEFAKQLQQAHPDVVKVVRKYGRWHHQVDYGPFRGNRLLRKKGLAISAEPNNYSMRLIGPCASGAA